MASPNAFTAVCRGTLAGGMPDGSAWYVHPEGQSRLRLLPNHALCTLPAQQAMQAECRRNSSSGGSIWVHAPGKGAVQHNRRTHPLAMAGNTCSVASIVKKMRCIGKVREQLQAGRQLSCCCW